MLSGLIKVSPVSGQFIPYEWKIHTIGAVLPASPPSWDYSYLDAGIKERFQTPNPPACYRRLSHLHSAWLTRSAQTKVIFRGCVFTLGFHLVLDKTDYIAGIRRRRMKKQMMHIFKGHATSRLGFYCDVGKRWAEINLLHVPETITKNKLTTFYSQN